MLQCGLHDDIVKSPNFKSKWRRFVERAGDVHHFNVLKMFSEANNIPKGI